MIESKVATKGGIRKPSGKETRLIILHAGSENGWIDGADLVFQSKKTTGDYHEDLYCVLSTESQI